MSQEAQSYSTEEQEYRRSLVNYYLAEQAVEAAEEPFLKGTVSPQEFAALQSTYETTALETIRTFQDFVASEGLNEDFVVGDSTWLRVQPVIADVVNVLKQSM